jgi:hypothetical protein
MLVGAVDQIDRVRAGISLHQNTVDCMKALLGAVNQFATFELDEEDRKTESALSAHDETKKVSNQQPAPGNYPTYPSTI